MGNIFVRHIYSLALSQVPRDLCNGVLKCVVSRYLQKGSNVYACFLDASKAFDRVNHVYLFNLLLKRNLPTSLVRFLLAWYKHQSISVRWNSTLSEPFSVCNGVRQGGVLSPILFTVYLDELISKLSEADIGCHFDHYFAGILCYADDIVLLSPSPSALRLQLQTCEIFAISCLII